MLTDVARDSCALIRTGIQVECDRKLLLVITSSFFCVLCVFFFLYFNVQLDSLTRFKKKTCIGKEKNKEDTTKVMSVDSFFVRQRH